MLYLFGFWHVHVQLRRHARVAAAAVALGLSTLMVIGGTYHALWSHYGFILQPAADDPLGTAVLLENERRAVPMGWRAVLRCRSR